MSRSVTSGYQLKLYAITRVRNPASPARQLNFLHFAFKHFKLNSLGTPLSTALILESGSSKARPALKIFLQPALDYSYKNFTMGLFRSSSTSPSKHTSPARSEGDTSEVNHTHGVGRHGHNNHGGSLHRKSLMPGMSSSHSSEASTTVALEEDPDTTTSAVDGVPSPSVHDGSRHRLPKTVPKQRRHLHLHHLFA